MLDLDTKQTKLLEFIKLQHGSQMRKYTDEPYWVHPLAVAELVDKFLDRDSFAIEIALGHDLLEDTECNGTELRSYLNSIGYSRDDRWKIFRGVESLSDVYTHENYPTLNRAKRKNLEALRLREISATSQAVKCADLIDNTISIVQHDPGFGRKYLREKMKALDYMRDSNIKLYALACHSLIKGFNELDMDITKI